ncbi:helix-turn-helix transcriptional regulator [Ottowia sp. SB7-C50]|uniref:helix-turn-helix transcriptional regulator n=1 Tax=Ottowia sp. SB7-C50 TaxID=3081231 RepID=UPI002952F10D|nr:AlpA family phage regulatory protein [Ottowia sp. SB7-C50]WOP14510.1 AlpA family phage regulatory protein [Ottowia sp. SB7-C50]
MIRWPSLYKGFIVLSTNPSIERKRAQHQPLHAIQIATALLKIQTVIAITGLSESTIRRKVAAGDFPNPIKDGTRCTRWIAADVSAWLSARADSKAVQ